MNALHLVSPSISHNQKESLAASTAETALGMARSGQGPSMATTKLTPIMHAVH